MYWNSPAEFFAMGGYGFYVWASFGVTAKVKQATVPVAQLREKEAASVPDFGVVVAKLMAVVSQRQWRFERAGKGRKPAEMRGPLRIVER